MANVKHDYDDYICSLEEFSSEMFADGAYTGLLDNADYIKDNPFPVRSFEWYEWLDGFIDTRDAISSFFIYT